MLVVSIELDRAANILSSEDSLETHADLRSPLIVMLGAWNSAIFSAPGWLAKHIYDFPEKTQFTIQVVQNSETGQSIFLFPKTGISLFGQRVEIFVRTHDEAGFKSAMETALKICQILPHTPVSALGVNFKYTVSSLSSTLLETLETKESLDSLGTSIRIEHKNQITQVNNSVLNLSRVWEGDILNIDFNFHYVVSGTNGIIELLSDLSFREHYEKSKETLSQVYELSDISTSSFPTAQG